ncbi:hypothetical protein Ancab_035302 [Ancistrocladus abbreviatus]
MAQAARLNLRMQKELKLLRSDPPLGASFPFILSSSDDICLSSIDAQIEGPEGTVYAGGVFKIKIQIPDRYPFQPPIVTFVTPIYHPNIDNGGRICLDILNLPPKGAWQPSLNISTILTSLGLLLSEPNPDDGLMCEASREYKYNRQAFDHKARTMTEKYAKAGSSGSDTHSIQHNANLSLMEGKKSENSINEDSPSIAGHDKPSTISWMLSQESSGSGMKRDDDQEVNEAIKPHLYMQEIQRKMDVQGAQNPLEGKADGCHLRHKKLSMSKWRLSIDCSGQLQKAHNEHDENAMAVISGSSVVHRSSNHRGNQPLDELLSDRSARNACEVVHEQASDHSISYYFSGDQCNQNVHMPQQLSNASDITSAIAPAIKREAAECEELQPCVDLTDTKGGYFATVKLKRFAAGRRLSLGSSGLSQRGEGQEECVMPVQKPSLQLPKSLESSSMAARIPKAAECLDDNAGCHNLNLSHKKCRLDQMQVNELTNKSNSSNDGNYQLFSQSQQFSPSVCKPSLMVQEKHQCSEEQSNCDEAVQNKEPSQDAAASASVIVLDSENSDEERDEHRRSKLSLARKRLGKWKVKA